MFSLIFIFIIGVVGCDNTEPEPPEPEQIYADITAVSASGPTGKYTFNVTISSPDTGCDQYADWWEVVDEGGGLIYRRILAHSHVNEQPFTRQGGTVTVDESENVWIRAHMNNSGYGGVTFFGRAKDGFEPREMAEGFAADVENESPQPTGCAF
ncbi:MAG: hypothetical protein RIF33_22045 [Cyclobacteriaceae bacterium]